MAKEQRNECEVGWHGEEVPGHSVLIHPTVTLAIHLDQALSQQKNLENFLEFIHPCRLKIGCGHFLACR